MPNEDINTIADARFTVAAKAIGINLDLAAFKAKWVETETTLNTLMVYDDLGVKVRIRDIAIALGMPVAEVPLKEYKPPPTTFRNPTARLQALFESQHSEVDPRERELMRLRSEARVRKLNAMELSTVARLERKPVSNAPEPVPPSVTVNARSAVEKHAMIERYQRGLTLNRELLNLRSNEAKLRGQNEHELAAHVRGMISDCQRRIEAN